MALAAWRAASFGDVIAGATVGATSLPQYIAYAELAGLSGLSGLRTSGPPLLGFAVITGSPVLSIGVSAITAIMAHSTLGGAEYREANGEEAWADLLGTFAVLVGLASMVLGLMGATRLVAYIPGPVKTGWKLGFAITVVASQTAGALFGGGAKFASATCPLPLLQLPWAGGAVAPISGGAASIYRLGWMVSHPMLWDTATVLLSGVSLLAVLKGKGPLKKVLRAVTFGKVSEPVAGLEVILACAAGTIVAVMCGYQGGVVGALPPSPAPEASASSADGGPAAMVVGALTGWVRRAPWEMPWAELAERLGGWPWAVGSATAFAAVNFLAIVSVVEAGPLGREMFGQGIGCVISGMAGSAPVGGSLSRSLVAKMTGASSPLAGLVNGLVTLTLAWPSIAGLLAPTPKAILAAVVLAAVLPQVLYPKDVLRLGGQAALVAWTTAAVSALVDPTKGFGAGLALHFALSPLKRKVHEK